MDTHFSIMIPSHQNRNLMSILPCQVRRKCTSKSITSSFGIICSPFTCYSLSYFNWKPHNHILPRNLSLQILLPTRRTTQHNQRINQISQGLYAPHYKIFTRAISNYIMCSNWWQGKVGKPKYKWWCLTAIRPSFWTLYGAKPCFTK